MFTCELCNYDSQRKFNLEKHLKSTKHANNVAKREKEEHDAREQRKHFVCPKCSKRFSKQQGLTRHTNRVKPCVETAIVQPQVINQTINNNTVNVVNYYAQALEENLYKDTTYDHITTECLEKAMMEFDRGNDCRYREDEVVVRYRALAMIISAVHWDVSYSHNRNMLVLSMLPNNDRRTGAEYFILDVDKDNVLCWHTADIQQFKSMMVNMLDTIQEEKQFDLTKMIDFFDETLNEQHIGLINKVIWDKYYSYMGMRQEVDKRYKRLDVKGIRSNKNTNIEKTYTSLVRHETLVSNGNVPIPVKSNFLALTN